MSVKYSVIFCYSSRTCSCDLTYDWVGVFFVVFDFVFFFSPSRCLCSAVFLGFFFFGWNVMGL